MAWTTPPAYTVGEDLTAALMNAISANFTALWQRGTSLPGSPGDGEVYCYTADATNGVEWLFKYNAGSASSFKWEFIGGPPMYAEITTSESTSSVTYAALATAGPSITVPRQGDYMVEIGYQATQASGVTFAVFMSYDIGGTGAVDADAAQSQISGGGTLASASNARMRRKTGIAASTALVSKYKVGSATSTAFLNRWMSVLPVRVI